MYSETYSERHPQAVLWLTYIMYLLVLPAVIAVAINLTKNRRYKQQCVLQQWQNMPGSTQLFASHYDWLLRSFYASILLVMMSIGTFYVGVGYALAIVTVCWWIARLIQGMVALIGHRPMPGYYC